MIVSAFSLPIFHSNSWRPVAVSVLVLAALAGQSPLLAQQAGPQLVLLDGKTLPFQNLEIADGKLRGTGLPEGLTLDDLCRIEVSSPQPPSKEKPDLVADLRGGGRIQSNNISIGDDKCLLQQATGEPLSLPLDMVRGIRLGPAADTPDFEKALATPSAETDRVFVKDDAGKLSSVTGMIKSLTAQQLAIEIGAETRNLPREKIIGVVIAQPTATDSLPRCLVTMRDGSTLGGETIVLANDKGMLKFPAGAAVSFPWSAVSRVSLRSSLVAFLSELKPLTEEQLAIVTLPIPAQRDKSVMGKPLKLGARIFEKGLGVHARSAITFAADKKWDLFAATIGIDAETEGKGDCVFSVLADGRSIFSRRMTGADAPYDVELPITNHSELTLLVEPGEGLDLADHGDWCEARFVKNRPK